MTEELEEIANRMAQIINWLPPGASQMVLRKGTLGYRTWTELTTYWGA